MSVKFIHHDIFYLDKELNEEQIDFIFKNSEEIKVKWGHEYVIFNHFLDSIYVDRGSPHLLSKGVVPIDKYDPKYFSRMLSRTKATSLDITLIDESLDTPYSPHLKVIHRLIDYSQTVTDLENLRFLSTTRSLTAPVVDERRFTLLQNSLDYVDVEEYVGETYEVDSLGSSFWKDLTEKVVELWQKTSHLKVKLEDE